MLDSNATHLRTNLHRLSRELTRVRINRHEHQLKNQWQLYRQDRMNQQALPRPHPSSRSQLTDLQDTVPVNLSLSRFENDNFGFNAMQDQAYARTRLVALRQQQMKLVSHLDKVLETERKLNDRFPFAAQNKDGIQRSNRTYSSCSSSTTIVYKADFHGDPFHSALTEELGSKQWQRHQQQQQRARYQAAVNYMQAVKSLWMVYHELCHWLSRYIRTMRSAERRLSFILKMDGLNGHAVKDQSPESCSMSLGQMEDTEREASTVQALQSQPETTKPYHRPLSWATIHAKRISNKVTSRLLPLLEDDSRMEVDSSKSASQPYATDQRMPTTTNKSRLRRTGALKIRTKSLSEPKETEKNGLQFPEDYVPLTPPESLPLAPTRGLPDPPIDEMFPELVVPPLWSGYISFDSLDLSSAPSSCSTTSIPSTTTPAPSSSTNSTLVSATVQSTAPDAPPAIPTPLSPTTLLSSSPSRVMLDFDEIDAAVMVGQHLQTIRQAQEFLDEFDKETLRAQALFEMVGVRRRAYETEVTKDEKGQRYTR